MISIRRAHAREARRLSEIAMAAKASWGYSASFMSRCRTALAVDPKTMGEREFHLAEDESGVLGFYGFEPEPDGIGLSHMFVTPEAAGRGVGRALWNHAIEQARRMGAAVLIAVSDPNAAGFYRRMGAAPAGARPSEIDPARPLPIYRLRLEPARPRRSRRAAKQAASR